jgi:murein DD-endopeptidase MepM/ murein hydrolase activator NlpD
MATDSEIFAQQFAAVTGLDITADENKWAYELYDVAFPIINSEQIEPGNTLLYDIILADDKAPQSYKDRFSAVTELKKKAPEMGMTVADYLKQENQYKQLLKSAGMDNLANANEIKKFFLNEVSYDEAASRINAAFSAIDSADEPTRQALAERFPTLNKADLAQGLLLGKEGTYEIEKKAAAAQVAGAGLSQGFRTTLTDEELVASGFGTSITGRTAAREAFGRVAAEQRGLQQAARTFGGPSDIVQQAEKEAVLGQTSAEARRLRSQARAQFAGQSGIVTGSLGRKKQA